MRAAGARRSASRTTSSSSSSSSRTSATPDEIARWASKYCVRLQESAGVDVIWDGEQQRSEMYAWAIAHSNGFEPRGTVRSFDNKYYSKSAATGPVSLREPYHNDEFSFLQSVAKHDLKIPITGRVHAGRLVVRRAPPAQGGPSWRRPLAQGRGRGPP